MKKKHARHLVAFSIFFYLISFLLVENNTHANIFEIRYGGVKNDSSVSIKRFNDGCFIIAGTTQSFGSGETDGYLIKIDDVGNVLWEKTYGGASKDSFSEALITTDGGIIAIGSSLSYGSSRGKFYLIKTDKDGNEEWMKTFGHQDYSLGFSVDQTDDDGFILLGNSTETDAWLDFRLTKLDKLGNEEWTKFISRSQDDTGRCVKQTSDGGYILTGLSGGWSSSPKMWIIRTNSKGEKIWDKTYGGLDRDNWDYGYYINESKDGNFVALGRIYDEANKFDIAFIKIDQDGNEIWFHKYGGSENDFGNEFIEIDEGYAIVGTTSSFGLTCNEVFLIETDENGIISYTQTFKHSENSSGGAGIATISNNHYAIIANTAVYDNNSDIYFIDFDKSVSCKDTDNDGVQDSLDKCPNTPSNLAVYSNGCVAEDIYDQVNTLNAAVNEKNAIINQLNEDISKMFTKQELEGIVSKVLMWGDTNGDGKIGLKEAINALLITAGVDEE